MHRVSKATQISLGRCVGTTCLAEGKVNERSSKKARVLRKSVERRSGGQQIRPVSERRRLEVESEVECDYHKEKEGRE